MRSTFLIVALLASAVGWPLGAAAQDSPPATPVVAEQADHLLAQMGAYLGSALEFTFHADVTFDHVLPSGQKLQYSSSEEVALQRPGRLYVEWSGDLGDRQFWYDGTAVTLFNPATPFYASDSAPPTIDAMLEKVVQQLGFSPPLADFLYSDPYRAVRGNLQFGVDLGVSNVNGRSCYTLAFVEKDIDWQIWIDTGPQLTPCKLVITYKAKPSLPQFSAVFTDWNFSPRIAAPVFTPTLPSGTQKIPFQQVTAAR
ncbi:MAG TPA: DUF2092 domain-containing protein [Acetobacteraceae bacterium]|nr:DUF2092 domain-containing protein [Acetobacteraceae bacterium]